MEEVVIGCNKSPEAVELTPTPTNSMVESSQSSELGSKAPKVAELAPILSNSIVEQSQSLELGADDASGVTKLAPPPTNYIEERSQSPEFLLKSGVPSDSSHDKDIKEVHVFDGECPCLRCPHHQHLCIEERGKVENKEIVTKKEEEKVKKKKSSWMPDPKNRWPIQGFQ